jgi:hypothetical protein
LTYVRHHLVEALLGHISTGARPIIWSL